MPRRSPAGAFASGPERASLAGQSSGGAVSDPRPPPPPPPDPTSDTHLQRRAHGICARREHHSCTPRGADCVRLWASVRRGGGGRHAIRHPLPLAPVAVRLSRARARQPPRAPGPCEYTRAGTRARACACVRWVAVVRPPGQGRARARAVHRPPVHSLPCAGVLEQMWRGGAPSGTGATRTQRTHARTRMARAHSPGGRRVVISREINEHISETTVLPRLCARAGEACSTGGRACWRASLHVRHERPTASPRRRADILGRHSICAYLSSPESFRMCHIPVRCDDPRLRQTCVAC